jgi:peptide/nickel transport system substrate-binding protein
VTKQKIWRLLKKSRFTYILVFVTFCISLTSCSNQTNINQQIPIEKNAVVTVAVPSLPTNYNPNVPSGNNFLTQQIMDCLWPQVFSFGGDYQTHLDTAIISQAELVSIDPQEIQYQIAPNAKWSDGVPVTVEDFIYNWRAHVGIGLDSSKVPFQSVQQPGYSDIASIVAGQNLGEFTVTFIKPFADWESLFSDLVPSHIAQQVGWNSGFETVSPSVEVSAGPYRIAKYIPNESLTLVINNSYLGPKPHINTIIFKVYSSQQSMLQAVVSNQAQMTIGQFSEAEVADLNANNQLNVSTHRSFSTVQLSFNSSVPVLASVQLREAIASLIDYNQLAADTIGLYNSGAGPLGNLIYTAEESGYSNDLGTIESSDQQTASQLISAANLSYNPQGQLLFNSQPVQLSLTYDSNDLMQSIAAQNIQAQLRDAGIIISLVSYGSSSAEQTALQNGNYQISIEKVTVYPYASYTTAGLTQDEIYNQPNGSWPIGIGINPAVVEKTTPQITTLVDEADSSLDTLKSEGLYQQVDNILLQNFTNIPLFQEPLTLVTNYLLQNVQFNSSIFGPLASVSDWAVVNEAKLTAGDT